MKTKSLTTSEISKRLSFSDDSEEESSDSLIISSDQNVIDSPSHIEDQGNYTLITVIELFVFFNEKICIDFF